MHTHLTRRLIERPGRVVVAALAAAVLALPASCNLTDPSGSRDAPLLMRLVWPGGGTASATAAFKATVSVTGPGITTPIVGTFLFDTSGTATATMTIPVGSPRILTIRIFDVADVLLFMGTDTISVAPGVNAPATVTITPTVGSVPITVIVGSFVVSVSPTSATIAVSATRTFSATVLAPGGAPSAVTAVWATSNPAIVSVDPVTGIATGRISGSATITATAMGVAAAATVTVP